jgi:Homeodomain-like domain
MAQTVCVIVSASDRKRLEAIASDRNGPRKHAERARVVLASARRGPGIAVWLEVSRPMVWRWQQRFAEAGVDRLLRDKSRKPGKPPIPAPAVARVVAMTYGAPPGEATHWTGRAMAKATDIDTNLTRRADRLGSSARSAKSFAAFANL